MLFISSWNLLTTKRPSGFFIWKRTHLNKRTTWRNICLFVQKLSEYCSSWTCWLAFQLQMIKEAVKWLFSSTAVNLTERLKVLHRLSCWIFSYFEAGDKKLPYFLSWQDERASSEVHWRLIWFLWPEISQMWRPLKPASDNKVYWLRPYQCGFYRPSSYSPAYWPQENSFLTRGPFLESPGSLTGSWRSFFVLDAGFKSFENYTIKKPLKK